MDACAFLGGMGALMQYNLPIPGQDDAILPKLHALGLDVFDKNGALVPYNCTQHKNQLPALQLAVAAARTFLSHAPTPPQTRTGWTVSLDVGTYEDHYLLGRRLHSRLWERTILRMQFMGIPKTTAEEPR